MKAGVMMAANRLEIQEMDIPSPGPEEILVKIKACGVCPTDVKKYVGSSHVPKLPFILGHEAAGTIEQLGAHVDKNAFHIGDRVVMGNIIPCGVCPNCLNGNDTYVGMGSCDHQEIFGVTMDGGFREYAPVPAKIVYPMPDEMTFHEAALVEPVACCLNAIEKANIRMAETVLILGAGFMGLVQLELARMRGARVVITDILDERLALAKQLGADLTVNPQKEDLGAKLAAWNGGSQADVVLCSVGGRAVMQQGIAALNRGGRLIVIGGKIPAETVELDPNELHYKQTSIIGAVSYTKAGFAQTIRLIADGRLSTKVLQSELIDLDGLAKAFDDVAAARGMRKCVIF